MENNENLEPQAAPSGEMRQVSKAELNRLAETTAKKTARLMLNELRKELWQIRHTADQRRWLSYKGAAIYSGLSTTTLESYVRHGHVRASHVKMPGNSRGRVLIDKESLDAFIEAWVNDPEALKMNGDM